jgi:hypothetical protein
MSAVNIAKLVSGRVGEIDDAARVKRAPVVDTHDR